MSEQQALRDDRPLQPAQNAITSMCIVRVDTSRTVPTLNGLRTQAGSFARTFDACYWPQHWADATALHLREHDGGRHHYGHMQVDGLLPELTWFTHANDDHAITHAAMNRLARATQDLAPHDRVYLVQALKQLTQMADASPRVAH